MLREPKTDRPLGIALLGSAYSVVAVLHTGDTLTGQSYEQIRRVTDEHGFLLIAVGMLALQIWALITVRFTARLPPMLLATVLWVAFGVTIFGSKPTALLPGYALALACCNSLALFDLFRERFHREPAGE